jgi:hypothetical protein
MALVGNEFADYVKQQINVRQKSLGEGLTDPRQLKSIQAYNSKTPWIRLASAVSITRGDALTPGTSVYDQLIKSGLGPEEFEGDTLSKKFVLYGGVNNLIGGVNNAPTGIINSLSDGTPDRFEGAYGYGYRVSQAAEQRGLIPPPGITNVEFEYKNDGALAFATINVKAFSEVQFQMIDILFQRPGYTCLLEFGHSVYLGNNGELVYPTNYSTAPFRYIYSPSGKGVNYSSMAEKIQQEKRKWEGNYEGFFGRIGKFSWKFNVDGSYDIEIKLTGTGDVISSLKVNTPKLKKVKSPLTFKGNTADTPSEKERRKATEDNAYLISEAVASQLNYELYSIFEDTSNFPLSGRANSSDIELLDIPVRDKTYSKVIPKGVFKVDVNDWGYTKYSPLTHIKFSVFLSMLQKVCNMKDSSDNYLLNFNLVENILTKGIDDTYIVTFPGNFSSNPNKCLIKYTSFQQHITKVALDEDYIVNKYLHKDPTPITDLEQPKFAMRLSDVYVDIGFISQTLKDLRGTNNEDDDEIEIRLLDLLKRILDSINTCLGGINSFRVMFDENKNSIKIISESPILNTKKDPNESLSELNTFGLTPGQGSFVKSMDLNSELSDQMATQISVGAQANANTNNANATAFSTYNKGLVDRLMVDKKDPNTDKSSKETNSNSGGSSLFSGLFGGDKSDKKEVKEEETKEEEPKDPIYDIFNPDGGDELSDTFYQVYGDREFGNDFVSTLENVNSTIAKKVIGQYTNNGESPVPFFLPFNLSLDMDGIGGMKIFEAFRVQGRGLPVSYNPKQISLIIKSLSHSVSLDGWITKVSTIAKPLFNTKVNDSSTNKPTVSKGSSTSPGGAGSSAGGNLLPPKPGELPPDDEKLRLRLFRIMDDGAQTLGYYEVLAEDEQTVLYRLAVSELPWKGNQNGVSAIPTGKFRAKSHTYKGERAFWYIGNEAGNYAFGKLYGNGYIRTEVLIHRAPKAVGWLLGCQGPGFKFNVKSKQKGRNQGTGDGYLEPSLTQSVEATRKLAGTLWSVGSFRVEINNAFDVLPTSWEDERVQNIVKDLQLV